MNIIDTPDVNRRLPCMMCLRCIFAKQEEATLWRSCKRRAYILQIICWHFDCVETYLVDMVSNIGWHEALKQTVALFKKVLAIFLQKKSHPQQNNYCSEERNGSKNQRLEVHSYISFCKVSQSQCCVKYTALLNGNFQPWLLSITHRNNIEEVLFDYFGFSWYICLEPME